MRSKYHLLPCQNWISFLIINSAILDDALHYLESHRLRGYHHSVAIPAQANGTTHSTEPFKEAWQLEVNGKSERIQAQPKPLLFVFSGTDASAVHRMVHSYNSYYSKHVSGHDGKREQLAYTLAARRSIMPWRTFSVAGSNAGSPVNGNGMLNGQVDTSQCLRIDNPIRSPVVKPAAAFIFTGQGAQYPGMGIELLRYPVFEHSFKKSDEILSSMGFEGSIIGTYITPL